MAGIKFALVITVALTVTGCRAITNASENALRAVAAAAVSPFLEAQAAAALTQSSFKKAPPSAVPRSVTPPEPEVVESLPRQRFVRAKLAPAPSGGRCGCASKPLVVLSTAS